MEQSFNAYPQVYAVLVVTKARGTIRRLDSVHATFENATKRMSHMYLNHDELAKVQAKALLSAEPADSGHSAAVLDATLAVADVLVKEGA